MPRAAGHRGHHNMLAHNTETLMEKHRTDSTWWQSRTYFRHRLFEAISGQRKDIPGTLTIPSVPEKEKGEIQMTLNGGTGWKEDHNHCEHLKGTTGISKCSVTANLRRNNKIQTGLGWSTTMPLQGIPDRVLGAYEPRLVRVKGTSFLLNIQFPSAGSFSSICLWQMGGVEKCVVEFDDCFQGVKPIWTLTAS